MRPLPPSPPFFKQYSDLNEFSEVTSRALPHIEALSPFLTCAYGRLRVLPASDGGEVLVFSPTLLGEFELTAKFVGSAEDADTAMTAAA